MVEREEQSMGGEEHLEVLPSETEQEVAEGFELPEGSDSIDPKESEREYSNHQDQLLNALPKQERLDLMEKEILEAFASVIEMRTVPFVRFGDLSAEELAKALFAFPSIIKPTLCCVNVATRALARDLGFSINPYNARVTQEQAAILAGYIKPMLPPAIAVPALMELDRYFWTDSRMRLQKGNWERTVTDAINRVSTAAFKKRKFTVDGEPFEIDAAHPGDASSDIDIAIDVKRIESPRDIHKRGDEIINKAAKFKTRFPSGRFIAMIYYPFPNQHINVQNRLHSPYIDHLFFAAETESSIAATAELLVGTLSIRKES